jgi:hypothetical protein
MASSEKKFIPTLSKAKRRDLGYFSDEDIFMQCEFLNQFA